MKKFKNDKERIMFLEDYRNESNGWYLWIENNDIDRRWWRYDLPDCSLIVEEQLQTFTWPKTKQEWRVHKWFIIHDWHLPFADGSASKSLALIELKRCEKEIKG